MATATVRAPGRTIAQRYRNRRNVWASTPYCGDRMALIDAPVGFAVAAGTVAAFNPCGFAMLPAYLSFFVASEADSDQGTASEGNPVVRALLVTAAMTVGFIVVFGLAGVALKGASLTVGEWTPYFTIAIGVLLMVIGVATLAGRALKINLPVLQRGGQDRSLASMVAFGASYATVSISCTLGIFLSAVSSSFSDGNILSGLVASVAYAFGMGLVIGVLTVSLALAREGIVRRVRAMMRYLNRITGILLVMTGAYVAYYGYYEIRTLDGDRIAAGPVHWVTDWSARVTERIDRFGATAIGVVLILLIGIGLWWYRLTSTSKTVTVEPITEATNQNATNHDTQGVGNANETAGSAGDRAGAGRGGMR